MFEIQGVIKAIMDEHQVTDSFKKREFVLTDNSSQYPQDILFQCTQANCDKISNRKVGDTVKIKFNLRGREWVNPEGEAKYFNSLDCWYVEFIDQNNNADGQPDEDPPF